jgi:hypothetical protein
LPNYTPFLELMSTPVSTLSINTAMDKMVKDKPDQEVSGTINPFASRELASSTTDLTAFEGLPNTYVNPIAQESPPDINGFGLNQLPF